MSERKMNVMTVSDEEIRDLFESSFKEQVVSYNDVGEFEAKCIRKTLDKNLTIEVTIFGMAGSPTPEDFKEMKIKHIDRVSIERADKGVLNFELMPKKTISLNTNNYIVVYKSI